MSELGYFHVYNRGVEERKIFLDNADYFRFILGMEGFNDTKPLFHLDRFKEKDLKNKILKREKDPLVEIICYSLMPNHYHILLRQLKEDGLSKFIQKLGIGYTKYFNKRYIRSGVLFQGGFKSKLITTNEYLIHLSRYIHLNALSLIQPDWVNRGIKQKRKAYEFLKNYKWHSLSYWIEKKPCLVNLNPGVVLNQFSSLEDFEDFVLGWIEKDYDKIKDFTLE